MIRVSKALSYDTYGLFRALDSPESGLWIMSTVILAFPVHSVPVTSKSQMRTGASEKVISYKIDALQAKKRSEQ